MKDPRTQALARQLVDYSLGLKEGDVFQIELKGMDSIEMGRELVAAATEKGAVPFWYWNDDRLTRPFLAGANEAQLKAFGGFHRALMERVDAFISIRGADNPFELSDVPHETMGWYNRHYMLPVHIEERVRNTRWVVLRWPNHAMAQASGMPQEVLEDFYYKVCSLDYARLSQGMDALVERLEATDRVHVTAPGGTDLRLSIKGQAVRKCDGKHNIPDGEVFTSPIRDSVEGTIVFNGATLYGGHAFDQIELRFEGGKAVEARAGDAAQTKALERILDTDEGARFVGEFAFGLNPHITRAMKDILFDEKIYGSIHMAMGNAYEDAPNGNQSAIHWDIVHIQTPALGGGQIHFDGALVRSDGEWVDPALAEALNKDALID